MNKYVFLIMSSILLVSVSLINYYYGSLSSEKVLDTLKVDLKVYSERTLKSVTPAIRNLLIQGNIRGARNILENWRSNSAFIGYVVFKGRKVIDQEVESLDDNKTSFLEIEIPIYYSKNGTQWGKVKYYVALSHLNAISDDIKIGFNKVFIYTSLIILFVNFILFFSVLISTQRLTILFDDYLKESKTKTSSPILSIIWGPMIKVIDEMAKKAYEWRLKSLEAEKTHTKEKIYRQVSHDIRSPLAALDMAIKEIDQLPESTRMIIRMSVQRIQDIANNLLAKNSKKDSTRQATEELKTTLLYSSLNEILSEKRLQFRSKINVNIEGDLNNGFGLFSKVNNTSLKRVISNLMNNAVEALPNEKGTVTISLEKNGDNALIKIKDNGKGIPPEILEKLGKEEGVSFGKEKSKESGSGLGLYYAVTTVEKWGSKLFLESSIGLGTIVNIEIPLSSPPSWFLSSVKLDEGDTVVVLDDDHEIHHIWDEKLGKYVSSGKLSIVHLTTPEETKKFFSDRALDNLFFLSDYELIGHKETGHDLIKELNIAAISTLVTSHYAEEDIQESCMKIGLKILPKMMAMNIDVEFNERSGEKKYLDAVYIEDDKYLRQGWEKAAAKKNIRFISIESPENFLDIQDQIKLDITRIYIDQNFENSALKGLDFANELHKKGYKNLFLATGFISEDFDLPSWITVRGKDCPWG